MKSFVFVEQGPNYDTYTSKVCSWIITDDPDGSSWYAAGFAIEGPSQAKIECDDQSDGSCDVKYWPKEPGEYAVHVMCDDEDIKNSPYMAYIQPASGDFNSDKVSCFNVFLVFKFYINKKYGASNANVFVGAQSHFSDVSLYNVFILERLLPL